MDFKQSASRTKVHTTQARANPLPLFADRCLRWSLDELPQFWNVFKGDMSLIGPRPEEARIVALYNDWHRRRLAVKPGITGPMQVNGRGDLPLDKRVQLELDYIENYSLWRDVVILLKTIPAVFKGKGAR
jgi:lipopolysaccharide/colanic/teichoic acid biosynthesis glycosyltransferase